MSQRIIQRRIDPVSFVASGTEYADIPRGMLIRELFLELNMVLAASSGAAIADASVLPGDEWAVVREIRIIANSTQVIRKFSGEQLRMLNYFYYGDVQRVSPLVAGVAAAGSLTIASSLRIPFWTPKSHTPIDTLLDTTNMSGLRIEVDWGTAASISSASGASFSTNPSLKLAVHEQDGAGNFAATRVFPILETAIAINESKRIQLPLDVMYRGLIINTKESDAGYPDAASAGNFLSNIKIQSGPTLLYDMPATQSRDIGFQHCRFPTIHDNAGNAIDSPFASAGSFLNSWYFIDFLRDRYMTEMPDAVGLSEFVLELNVNTLIDRLTIIPLTMYPVRNGKK